MPSLQQARHEAFAARVEAARRSLITTVASLVFPEISPDSVPTRIERMDGSSFEFQLEEVQLDSAELLGRAKKAVVTMPLDEVKAVWVRRLRPRRAAAVYLAILGAAELFVVLFAKPPVSIVTLGMVGVLLGGPLCAGAWIVLKRLKAFQEWVLLFDRADLR